MPAQCSLHTCLPLVVVIFLNASLTHFLLHAQYHSMHPLCLYLHLLFIHAFALLILSTCLRLLVLSIFCSLLILFCFPVHLHITILSHLISCASWSTNYSFAHLPTCHFLLPFLPCYFRGFSFRQIPILFTISMFNFATLSPYTSPPPSFTLFIVIISSLFYSSFNFISDFSPALISFLLPFYIFGTTYVWPFFVILWLIFEDFCALQYFTILHLIYDAKYVYISSLFLQCVGNNCLYIVFDIL